MDPCESCEICGDSSDVIEDLDLDDRTVWICSLGTCGFNFQRMIQEESHARIEDAADRLRDSFLIGTL